MNQMFLNEHYNNLPARSPNGANSNDERDYLPSAENGINSRDFIVAQN